MKDYNPVTIQPYIGNMKQLAGIKTSILDNGRGKDMRIADFHNSSGLSFTVLPDRAMDIGLATYKDTPISFLTPTGYSRPDFYDPRDLGWLRNWGGGLLTTCGLNNVGGPKDNDPLEGPNGLHGRISNTPAEIIQTFCSWNNDRYEMIMKGIIRDNCLFGRNIELHREIKTYLGESTIEITDEVINLSHKKENVQILYHMNIGYPFLSEHCELHTKNHKIVPRDKDAEMGIKKWNNFQKPVDSFKEQVFFHDIPADNNRASIILKNTQKNLSLQIDYSKDTLPNFWQWKMMEKGTYVLGLEPTNIGMENFGIDPEPFTTLKGYGHKKFSIKLQIIENT